MADSTINVRILSIVIVLPAAMGEMSRHISIDRLAENSNGSWGTRNTVIPGSADSYWRAIPLMNALLPVKGMRVYRGSAGLFVVDGLRPVTVRVDLYVVHPAGIERKVKPLTLDRADAVVADRVSEGTGPESL